MWYFQMLNVYCILRRHEGETNFNIFVLSTFAFFFIFLNLISTTNILKKKLKLYLEHVENVLTVFVSWNYNVTCCFTPFAAARKSTRVTWKLYNFIIFLKLILLVSTSYFLWWLAWWSHLNFYWIINSIPCC